MLEVLLLLLITRTINILWFIRTWNTGIEVSTSQPVCEQLLSCNRLYQTDELEVFKIVFCVVPRVQAARRSWWLSCPGRWS